MSRETAQTLALIALVGFALLVLTLLAPKAPASGEPDPPAWDEIPVRCVDCRSA